MIGKKIFTLVLLLVSVHALTGQTIEFESKSVNLLVLPVGDSPIDIPIKIEGELAKDVTLYLVVSKAGSTPGAAQLAFDANTLQLQPGDGPNVWFRAVVGAADLPVMESLKLLLSFSPEKQLLASDATVGEDSQQLKITGNTSFEICLVPAHQLNRVLEDVGEKAVADAKKEEEEKEAADKLVQDRYRIGVGTNFDFLNGKVANSLYYDLRTRVPTGFGGRVGFGANVTAGRTFTRIDSANRYDYIVDIPRLGLDSVDKVNFRYKQIQKTRQEFTAVDANLWCRINDEEKLGVGKDGTNVYWTTGVQYIWRKESLDVTVSDIDSAITGTVAYNPDMNFFRQPPQSRNVERPTEHEVYWGTGVTILHQNKHVELMVHPEIGWRPGPGRQGLGQNMYGFTTFYLLERTTGIKLGGEVRSLTLSELHDPVLYLYVAKTFTIKDGLDTIGFSN